jgi:hypothetical protein
MRKLASVFCTHARIGWWCCVDRMARELKERRGKPPHMGGRGEHLRRQEQEDTAAAMRRTARCGVTSRARTDTPASPASTSRRRGGGGVHVKEGARGSPGRSASSSRAMPRLVRLRVRSVKIGCRLLWP